MSEKVNIQKGSIELYSLLSDPFPEEMEHNLSKGGRTFTYIPVSEVINRLNKVVGVDGWSYTVISCARDRDDTDFIIAHVRAVITSPSTGQSFTRDGIGGQKIKRTKNDDIVDLGDEYKGAISDALKKALQAVGIALYLSRNDDAIEIEQVMEANTEESSQDNTTNIVAPKEYERVKGLYDALDDDGKARVKEFWATYGGGEKKLMSQMTEEELLAISVEIIAIQFGGEVIDEKPKPKTSTKNKNKGE